MLSKNQFCFWILASLLSLSSLLSSVYSTSCQKQQDEEPKVRIKNGTLIGLIMETRQGRKFDGFLGIPYALPPIGKLRFEKTKYFYLLTVWNIIQKKKRDKFDVARKNISDVWRRIWNSSCISFRLAVENAKGNKKIYALNKNIRDINNCFVIWKQSSDTLISIFLWIKLTNERYLWCWQIREMKNNRMKWCN